MFIATTSASACLITNPVEFAEDVNDPPVILDKPGTANPIGENLTLDLDDNPSRIEITVSVRDENVEQDLFGRTRLSTMDGVGGFEPIEIPSQGELLRDLTVRVEIGNIVRGECHRLDLVVSGAFIPGEDPRLFDLPLQEGDVARASWDILEVSGEPFNVDNPEASQRLLSSCQKVEALVITGLEEEGL